MANNIDLSYWKDDIGYLDYWGLIGLILIFS